MRNMSRGIPHLFKEGYKQMSGLEEAIMKNCEAATDLSETVQSAFGPYGLSKIVINRNEKVIITTDASAILSELEVQHPAAKVLVLAAAMQQREIGDGANFVIIFAGELLRKALEILRLGIHPADMVRGYRMAQKKAVELMKSLIVYEVKREDMASKEKLMLGIRAAIGSKQHGNEEVLSSLVADAAINSLPSVGSSVDFNVSNVRTLKILGDRVESSFVVDGMVLDRYPMTVTKKCDKAKVAIFTVSVGSLTTETTGNVLIHSAEELLDYNASEERYVEKLITSLYEMGVRLVVTKENFDEMALHYMDKFGMVAIKLVSKFRTRAMCRTLGARPIVNLNGVRPEDLGDVDRVYTREIGSKYVTVFEADRVGRSPVSTILLRGATHTILDDSERAIEDGINVVRAMTRTGKFVAGGGACELELARKLKDYARTVTGLEQYAIEAYAEALEVVPRTLAENAGLDDTEIITSMYKAHATASVADSTEDGASAKDTAHRFGLDIESGTVKDVAAEGIIDLLATRQMGIVLATQAANTILRVDHIIMKKPAGGPRFGEKRGHWDDNDETW
jgi:T-complex protein 1 subunit theta